MMMQLFPRSAKELRQRLLEFPTDLIRDFREDLAKLNEVYQTFHNINKNSKGRKGARRANFKGGASGEDVDQGGPVSITMEQIALAGSGHLGKEGVGVNMEIFRWVQRGRRKEAKWCPGEILDFRNAVRKEETIEEHLVKWVTPLGEVEEAWLDLMEESLKIPAMDTSKVIASHEAETKEQKNARFDDHLAARLKTKKAQMERENEELASRIRFKAKAEKHARRNIRTSSTAPGKLGRSGEGDPNDLLESRIRGKLSGTGRSGELRGGGKGGLGGGGGGGGGGGYGLGGSGRSRFGGSGRGGASGGGGGDDDDDDPIIARLQKKTTGSSGTSSRGNVLDQLKRAEKVKQRRLREQREANGSLGRRGMAAARLDDADNGKVDDEDLEDDPILRKLNSKLKERGGLGAAPSAKERDKQEKRKMLSNARRRTQIGMKRGTKPILSPIAPRKTGSAPAPRTKLSKKDLGENSDSGSDDD